MTDSTDPVTLFPERENALPPGAIQAGYLAPVAFGDVWFYVRGGFTYKDQRAYRQMMREVEQDRRRLLGLSDEPAEAGAEPPPDPDDEYADPPAELASDDDAPQTQPRTPTQAEWDAFEEEVGRRYLTFLAPLLARWNPERVEETSVAYLEEHVGPDFCFQVIDFLSGRASLPGVR